jgi:hypothetical protein
MPKRPNAHKLASQSIRNSDALEAALEGKYEIGLIEATLGHSAFRIALSRSLTRTVSITSAVLRGGKTSSVYAQRGHYLIVSDAEVIGVVNTSAAYRALRKAGRIPQTASDADSNLDEFFSIDRSGEKEEIDIWAKKDEERIAQAANLERRIRRRRAGVAERAGSEVRIEDDSGDDSDPTDLPEPAVVVPEEAAAPADGPRQITSARRLRALALKEAAERAAMEAEIAAIQAAARAAEEAVRARYAAEEAEEERLRGLSKPKSKSWEEMSDDEIDIDSI